MTAIIGIAAHQQILDVRGDGMGHYVVAAPYVRAVRKAGGIPIILPVVDLSEVNELLDRIDGLVLTGGTDVDPARYGAERSPDTWDTTPERDAVDIELCGEAIRRNLPTLAICRGVQILNVTLGGTMTQHIDDHMRLDMYNAPIHEVEISTGSRLASALEIAGHTSTRLGTNSLHHQCIDAVGGRGIVVAAAPDGTVEALEVDGASNVLGVQWHPELMRHIPEHLALFQQLLTPH